MFAVGFHRSVHGESVIWTLVDLSAHNTAASCETWGSRFAYEFCVLPPSRDVPHGMVWNQEVCNEIR